MRVISTALLALAMLIGQPATSQAQTFGPVITVNNEGISGYELEQREKFVTALRLPGDPARLAREGLIEDKLKLQAARAAGLEIGIDELELGLEEFASRANLTTEQFIAALADEGVAPETFRDFVRADLVWRELIRQRFGPRARVSDAEVERALALQGAASGARIRVAEIIIPTPPDRRVEAETLAANIRERVQTTAQFSEAAQRFSAASSRANGGLRDWIAVSELPPGLAQRLLTLGPGDVSDPVPLGDQAIALFQVRGFQESAARAPSTVSVDLARLPLPADPEAAARLRARLAAEIDVCDDLYGLARDLPEGSLRREVLAAAEIPSDIATALAGLDNQESTEIARAGGREHIMLCTRTTALEEDDEGTLRRQLLNQRLGSYAANYLQELLAEATIQ
ncbi:SurA domain protein [Dinoroseobacter shibae DFL 12 = DSM 16493]|jgi:peptidyl-prolyl cis-trans isomerase SurA|uniref:Parvulin-like PPIase n=1 Tax=Dinoroseobacter shibae (strain DSM 16493 / NCIMB 14021 / DFL 12) TaxID=398580 RepID=A8LI75_DINSH|nr:peptidylprolyl isomerase [Dinoroseobacter shibae]ABV92929.1 SurA domain protein [Dinoroseobacter shibae DFL 12 = DSM 16493]URF47865.1 peptidylprolyl isomerase [Dinoroseobacter shibae]URF52174.1 peptidylprolyl isomerase [Dinoroseobacter shibae]